MQNQPMTEKESLALISDMINKTKDSFHETGFGPIMWGGIITICSLFTFCSIQFSFKLPFDIWILTLVALVPQIIYSINESKKKGVKTYNDVAMDYTWIAFGVTMFLISTIINTIGSDLQNSIPNYMQVRGNFKFSNHTTAFYLMLYGIPTFITGGVMKYKPMLIGGILFWVLSLISNFTDSKIDMLLMAFGALAAWFIPGLMLFANFRKINKGHV
jgi:hypothetical protein